VSAPTWRRGALARQRRWLSPADFVGARAGLLIAGTDDVYVPLEGTRAVYDRLTGPKDLIEVQGANHIDFYDQEPYVSTAVRGHSW